MPWYELSDRATAFVSVLTDHVRLRLADLGPDA